jgi:hypothetical protein
MILKEGGNVFKDQNGRILTQRINQTDIDPTVTWLEELTGLDLHGELDPDTADASHPQGYPERWLGSTGKKDSSGDLDLGVDANQFTKDQMVARLSQWCQSHGFKPEEYIKKTGSIVHFKTPINGRPDKGYVQTDFTFLGKPKWSQFVLSGGLGSQYKGRERNVMMNSMAKTMGYKVNQNDGIMDRVTNQLITDDPDKVAKILLNPRATRADLRNVENILKALERDPKRDAKIADFRAHMEREGLPFMESTDLPPVTGYTEVDFLARLRDRIVNQGMQVIVEGAKDARIEHLEDLVFEKGTRGIREAVEIMRHAAENTRATTTVKWDGKPAIIFGRKPDGTFVLTDKSGFSAKGYDGLATSPEHIQQIMSLRKGDRTELVAIYQKLFPLLRAATPENMRGYVQGDLLYTDTPPEVAGAFVFRPNFVEYKIPAGSQLGQRIAASEVGVAIHTRYKDPDSSPTAIKNITLDPVAGLLLIEPSVKDIQNIELNAPLVKQLSQIISVHGKDIDGLFNPADLRSAGITDLPQLCKRYINSRITSNYDNLLNGFGDWLQANVTPRKFSNIVEYLQSPRSNTDGITAAFAAFMLLHDIKTDMLTQLDRQQPGQEGWVLATPAGRAKLVNRFGFSAGNRALNNPEQAA